MYKVNYKGRTYVTCEQLYLLSCSTRMTVTWCWARSVSDS